MNKKAVIALDYANLAVCALLYLLMYSQLTDYTIGTVQQWVRDGGGGGHTESCSVKNPTSVLGSLAFVFMLFQVNRKTIRSVLAPPAT